jgi:nucleoside-diphosphate-sugar epimerase
MRVAIAGGHGKIAMRLTRILKERGDEIGSIVRNPDHADDVRDAGGEPIVCDLEEASVDELAAAIGAADAVVFAAGAGPGSGSARKETMDYGGAMKLLGAAKMNGIDRYVMIGSYGADANIPPNDTFAIYLRAKGRADEKLMASGLDYTIVRPTGLTDDPGTGRVEAAEHVRRGSIPREDVAALVAASLQIPQSIGKVFELTSGDMEIEEALRNL